MFEKKMQRQHELSEVSFAPVARQIEQLFQNA